MQNLKLENLEKKYLDFNSIYLRQWCDSLIKELEFLITNKKDIDLFFHYFLKRLLKHPVTPPPDSFLNFNLPDAFIHIEVKTALINNPADYKGKINIAINQTPYEIKGQFTPRLPQYYSPKGNRMNLTLNSYQRDIMKKCLELS